MQQAVSRFHVLRVASFMCAWVVTSAYAQASDILSRSLAQASDTSGAPGSLLRGVDPPPLPGRVPPYPGTDPPPTKPKSFEYLNPSTEQIEQLRIDSRKYPTVDPPPPPPKKPKSGLGARQTPAVVRP
jgi:hypothetical protein